MKITRYRSIPSLRKGISKFAGRNSTGQITVRHRGGGHKQAYRYIDWNRNSGTGFVVGFEYDPNRNARIAKLYHTQNLDNTLDYNKNFSYILAPTGLKLFQELSVYNNQTKQSKESSNNNIKLLQAGDYAKLSSFESGDFMHAVEAYPGQGAVFARAAGTFCQVRSLSQDSSATEKGYVSNWAKVRLPSGSHRLISLEASATYGSVSIHSNLNKNLKKAGRSRWLGVRPSVRGVARNPVDHPHGGGQGKTSGGRPSVTFKSWPTKGQPTRSPKRKNPLILTSRKRLYI